jgi:hypothetical protein
MEPESQDSGPGAGEAGDPPHISDPSRGQAADVLRGHVEDLIREARIYVSSQIDMVKAAIRRGVMLMIVGVVALLGAVTLFVTAVVLLCLGVSDAISQVTGRRWAGEFAVGLFVVGGAALAATIGIKWVERRARRRSERKYDAMHQPKNGNGKRHD